MIVQSQCVIQSGCLIDAHTSWCCSTGHSYLINNSLFLCFSNTALFFISVLSALSSSFLCSFADSHRDTTGSRLLYYCSEFSCSIGSLKTNHDMIRYDKIRCITSCFTLFWDAWEKVVMVTDTILQTYVNKSGHVIVQL